MEPSCLKTNFICVSERNSCGFHDSNLLLIKVFINVRLNLLN